MVTNPSFTVAPGYDPIIARSSKNTYRDLGFEWTRLVKMGSILSSSMVPKSEGLSKSISKRLNWAKLITSRYVGQEKSELYGRRNSAGGELLIKIKPIRVIGQKDIAAGNPTNLKINLPIGKIIYGRINSSFLQRS